MNEPCNIMGYLPYQLVIAGFFPSTVRGSNSELSERTKKTHDLSKGLLYVPLKHHKKAASRCSTIMLSAPSMGDVFSKPTKKVTFITDPSWDGGVNEIQRNLPSLKPTFRP